MILVLIYDIPFIYIKFLNMVHLHVTIYVCIRKLNKFNNFTMALPGYIMYIMVCVVIG